MPNDNKSKDREDYEVEEIEMNDKEIESLIEKLQNLNYGEHVHLAISKNKELIINKVYTKK